jgi:hypothetical protein
MFRKLTILSVMTGFCAFLALSGTADARWVQSSVYNCHATGGKAVDSMYAIANDSTTSDLVLRCDIWDTSLLVKHGLDYFHVHGRDGTTTGRLASQVCRSSKLVPGGACSASSYSSTADVKNEELSLNMSVWDYNHRYDYGYVAIRIPPKQGSSRSSINGIKYGR